MTKEITHMQTQTTSTTASTPTVDPDIETLLEDLDMSGRGGGAADDLTDLDMSASTPAPAPAKPTLTKEERLAAGRKRAQERAEAKKAKEKEAAKAAKIEQAALDAAEKKIKLALAKGADAIVEVGEELNRIKQDHKGRFTKWREDNLRLSNGSANNYMNAATAVKELRGLVAADKHDAIYRLKPTILYGWHKLDDDGKTTIATKVENGEIVDKLPPRKPKEQPASSTSSDEGSPGEDHDADADGAPVTVQANDPDTKAAEELARKIVAALPRDIRNSLRNHLGYQSLNLGKALKSAMIQKGKFG
jgi:hypothetical protein